MATKITRGEFLVFTARPKDYLGNAIEPTSILLYIYYKHADGTSYTDSAIFMEEQSDGSYKADFDTAVTLPGQAFASIRTENPAAAVDFKFTIVANPANPEPGVTA